MTVSAAHNLHLDFAGIDNVQSCFDEKYVSCLILARNVSKEQFHHFVTNNSHSKVDLMLLDGMLLLIGENYAGPTAIHESASQYFNDLIFRHRDDLTLRHKTGLISAGQVQIGFGSQFQACPDFSISSRLRQRFSFQPHIVGEVLYSVPLESGHLKVQKYLTLFPLILGVVLLHIYYPWSKDAEDEELLDLHNGKIVYYLYTRNDVDEDGVFIPQCAISFGGQPLTPDDVANIRTITRAPADAITGYLANEQGLSITQPCNQTSIDIYQTFIPAQLVMVADPVRNHDLTGEDFAAYSQDFLAACNLSFDLHDLKTAILEQGVTVMNLAIRPQEGQADLPESVNGNESLPTVAVNIG